MGVDEGNIQVMNGCRNDDGKLPNSYGEYLQVQIKETLPCFIFSVHV